MRKCFVIVIAVVILGLLLGGFGCKAQTQNSNLTQPTSTSTQPVKIITIKINFMYGADSIQSVVYNSWMADVEKKSNGRLKFEPYWSYALAPSKQVFQAVGSNICQWGVDPQAYYPSLLPISQTMLAVGISKNGWAVTQAASEFMQNELVQKEFAALNVKPLVFLESCPVSIISKKPVQKVDDFKGLRIYPSTGKSEMVTRLGAVPVSLTAPELYDALQRGTIDAVLYPSVSMAQWRMFDVAKYFTNLMEETGFTASNANVVNLDFWNSLPKDLQQILMPGDELINLYVKLAYVEDIKKLFSKTFPESGVTIVDMPATERQKFMDISVNPDKEIWITNMEKQGFKVRESLDLWASLNKKWEAKIPAEFK